jgi:hypothetical protein
MKTERFNESLDFVARHYRRGAFDTASGLRRLGFRRRPAILRRVAVIAGAVALTASALFVGYYNFYAPDGTDSALQSAPPAGTPVAEPMKVVRLEFSNASLSEVTDEICRVYGVTLANIPIEDYRLTLSHEGNAYDLVETINELLGTDIVICD